MKLAAPHYLLFSESCRRSAQGQWRFVLQTVDGSNELEAADAEPGAQGERLELLAVVRGLEALAQPSRVTLVTPSRYVQRGLAYGLAEWRSSGWQWEHYGEMVPVKNRDLWQRVDHALTFHDVECRTWRFDLPHATTESSPHRSTPSHATGPVSSRRWQRGRMKRNWIACRRWWDERRGSLGLWGATCGTWLLPLPWLQ